MLGLKDLKNDLHYSCQGLKACWRHERAFKQEVVLCLVLIPIALWYGHSPVECVLLIGSLLLVLLTELVNSAIEATIDRVSVDHHPLSGRAKDLGSAAVFVALCMAAMTWGLILFL